MATASVCITPIDKAQALCTLKHTRSSLAALMSYRYTCSLDTHSLLSESQIKADTQTAHYGTLLLALHDTRQREAYILRAPPAGTYGKSEGVCITPIDKALALYAHSNTLAPPLLCCCPLATLAHSTHSLSRKSKQTQSTTAHFFSLYTTQHKGKLTS